MNGTHAATHESVSEGRRTGIFAGSALEGFGAIAAIALSIVGLVGVFPPTMAAIAAIVVGAGTLIEGGAFGLAGVRETRNYWFAGFNGADLQAGLGTVVLGILALLGIASHTLLSVAVIALGAAFLLSYRVMIGLGAVVLGILAVVGIAPLTLVLVGLLILGAGLLFMGSQVAVSTAAGA